MFSGVKPIFKCLFFDAVVWLAKAVIPIEIIESGVVTGICARKRHKSQAAVL